MKQLHVLIIGSVLIGAFLNHTNAQWVQTNGPTGGHAMSLVVNGTNIFAGFLQGGIYQSTDNGNSVNINPFFTLTVNSADGSVILNYFGTLRIFTQSILYFIPSETHYFFFPFVYSENTINQGVNYTEYFFYLTPRKGFSLGSKVRLITSAKFFIDSSSSCRLITRPSMQMDLQL